RQLHLQLALVADHGGGLLDERLVLPLGVLDRLLDLHLRVGILIDLGAEQRHQVSPALDERVRHICSVLSATAKSRTGAARAGAPVDSSPYRVRRMRASATPVGGFSQGRSAHLGNYRTEGRIKLRTAHPGRARPGGPSGWPAGWP